MSEKNFKIYRSSAGSGKTYTLTKEYLKLALRSPVAYRQILAVTFTNKATQEMKGRIIEQLHLLSGGQEIPLASELSEALAMDKMTLQNRAMEVLSNILHGYSHFAVSTIDSFFQKVIRAFSREIGLQSGFKIELDLDKVLYEVIDKVLLEIGNNEQLTRWLIQFAENKVDEGKSWDFRTDIGNLAREVFNESYKSFEKHILDASREKHILPQFIGKINALKSGYENTMKALGQKALLIAEAYDLEVEDFAYGKNGVMGYLQKITRENEYGPGTRPKKALVNPDIWSTKSSPKKDIIKSAVENGLEDILSDVINLYHRQHLQYESACQVLRYIYTFGVLTDIAKKLQEYRQEHDVMLISDASVFLKGIIGENEAPFIYEKVGTRLRHYLIDEFQDTSAFQWDNFKPLVANSIAEGKVNLVVGDVKQSIYRWRGGDWKLLLEQVKEDIGGQQSQELQLNQNWRSCENIINFNNQFFNLAPFIIEQECRTKFLSIDDMVLKDSLDTKVAKIREAYKDVAQHIPDSKINNDHFKGHVRVELLDPVPEEKEGEAQTWKESVLEKLPVLVENLQDTGYKLKDIAFLVRNKREGKLIADTLLVYKSEGWARPGYSYDVISSESLYLESSAVVRLLMNCLIYLNNPEDGLARAELIYEYQKCIRKNDAVKEHTLFRAASDPEMHKEVFGHLLPEKFLTKRPYLSKLPLFELVEELIAIFQLSNLQKEYAYLQAFLDTVLDFSRDEKADISSFLQWWKEGGKENAVQVSEELNAIRILTIHKSKGLQFKVVLVPFCDWNLDHNTTLNNVLWCSNDIAPFNEIKYLPLKYTGALKNTIYRQDYFEEMIKAYMDAFNLLYVAFTRAEDSLYVFGSLPKFNNKGGYNISNVSDLLYHILSNDYTNRLDGPVKFDFLGSWEDSQAVFEIGKPGLLLRERQKQGTNETISLNSFISNHWRNKLTIRHKSKEFFKEMEGTVSQKINYGLLMHSLMAKIKTSDQLPDALDEMLFEGMINEQERKELEEKIQSLLAREDLKQWFSSDWEVKTEVPVLTVSGNLSRLDRVMIKDNKAIVLDFKSSQKNSNHQKQVRAYASLLVGMGYTPVEGYLFYLEEAELLRVV